MRSKKAFLTVLVATSVLLCSCSKKEFSDDVDCDDIAEKIKSPALEYGEYDEEYLDFFFDATTLQDDFCIIYSNDVNDITEIGIFHTQNTDAAEELSAIADNYISEMQKNQRAFIGSYAPEELPKLDSAEVKIFGNYVVYAISDDNEALFAQVKDTLKMK